VVLSSRRFEEANVSRDLGLDAYEADPGMGHAVLEKVSRVSTTVPPETCDNPFVTHAWRVTRAPDATVPVPYTPWVDPLAPPAPEVDLDAIDESIPEWMRKYDFPPPPPSPPPPPPPPDLDASDAAAWRRDFAAGAPIARGSKLTFVPDGPGEYVVRVDAAGSCAGQTASSEASLRVDCNEAPVPDAAVFDADDVVLALETPSFADADGRAVTGPPPTNDTGTNDTGTNDTSVFSALDAGARVSTYAAASPQTPRCFKKTILDGSKSRDPEEGRPWRGGDAFTTAWSVVSAPPASALRGARWTGGASASFAQRGVVATLRPDREGTYACVAETYDGCAEASTKTFFVDVVWDDACLAKSRDVATVSRRAARARGAVRLRQSARRRGERRGRRRGGYDRGHHRRETGELGDANKVSAASLDAPEPGGSRRGGVPGEPRGGGAALARRRRERGGRPPTEAPVRVRRARSTSAA